MDYRHLNFPVIPANKGILYDDEIWQIVAYVRHLSPKVSLGEPAVSAGGNL